MPAKQTAQSLALCVPPPMHVLQGKCSNRDCPYLHTKVAADAPPCKAFLAGYCPRGAACTHKHLTQRMARQLEAQQQKAAAAAGGADAGAGMAGAAVGGPSSAAAAAAAGGTAVGDAVGVASAAAAAGGVAAGAEGKSAAPGQQHGEVVAGAAPGAVPAATAAAGDGPAFGVSSRVMQGSVEAGEALTALLPLDSEESDQYE